LIDFGTNQKHVCDFLLVRHSNVGPILDQFRDIALFYSRWTRSPMSGSARGQSIKSKLISREIIFEVFQPVWNKTYLNVTDRRMDRRLILMWHNRALSIAR